MLFGLEDTQDDFDDYKSIESSPLIGRKYLDNQNLVNKRLINAPVFEKTKLLFNSNTLLSNFGQFFLFHSYFLSVPFIFPLSNQWII